MLGGCGDIGWHIHEVADEDKALAINELADIFGKYIRAD